ncbi:hypothetical protein H7J51_20080 [Mycobacterium crocinum]|uniref:Glycoside hydrolase n=1 Tax=Mycolicibacterium crocinum TaxID=388459 RepID=A0ABY3TQ39_9MYCO|nr:hypothetical protein [Mycolicibacterium crocinum]MCV7217578.1 hypothetical protein [Mycolicibacterium crocinum]ULN42456.1 hypothetical protein MI149_04865 [Mycolicibacterium crocinum]
MKRRVLIACVSACLALVTGGVAAADPDTGTGGSAGSSGKTPSSSSGSSGKTPPPSAGATPAPVPASASKLGSEPTGSLSPKTKSTLATQVARVDKDIAEVNAAVQQIHNDPAMPPEAVQAADAEADVLAREQQIIHEIAAEEGFEPTPDTVPAPSVPEPPAAQPAVTRATVTGDLYAALALLNSRNSVASVADARAAQLAPLLDALRAAEAAGDPQAIQNARAAIEFASAAEELTILEQTTARLQADADRVLQGYTIPDGIIAPQR